MDMGGLSSHVRANTIPVSRATKRYTPSYKSLRASFTLKQYRWLSEYLSCLWYGLRADFTCTLISLPSGCDTHKSSYGRST